MSSEEDEYNFLDSISSTESSELTDSDTSTSDGGDNIISVSDLTDLIKDAIKINFDKGISIIGEISNYKSSKGHIYFTLKDTDSSINTIVWSYMSKKINIKLENGSKVIVTGIINIFNKAGTYNLIAHDIKSVGVGDLHQEYLKLKEHYDKLGYFKDDHKKKLPLKINKVGIITASDGAALQDFLYVLKKNNYNGEIYIKNCLVQGKGCPNNVAKCIELLDEMNLDVIVLARGGGSFEDLFGFSDKKVIETVYNCVTPVISAIGHEVDFMLSDFVADIRAPTPSIAGEIVSGKKEGVFSLNDINEIYEKIKGMIEMKFSILDNEIKSCRMMIKSPEDIMNNLINETEYFDSKFYNLINSKLIASESILIDLSKRLQKYQSLNQSHSSQIKLEVNGNIITDLSNFASLTKKSKKLKIIFPDGEVLLDMRNIKILTDG